MGKTSGLIEAAALHMLHDGETYMRAGVREVRACMHGCVSTDTEALGAGGRTPGRMQGSLSECLGRQAN